MKKNILAHKKHCIVLSIVVLRHSDGANIKIDNTDDYNKWCINDNQTFTMNLSIDIKAFLDNGVAHKKIQEFILIKFSDAEFFIINPKPNVMLCFSFNELKIHL